MTFIPTDNFLLKVARGKVPGMALVFKFGEGVVGTTERDIWNGGNVDYVYPTAAITLYLSSSDTGDTSAPIVIQGLDTNGDYQTETVTLDGANAQTQAASVNTYTRIFRALYAPTGGSWAGISDLAGDVYISSTNGDITAGVPNTAADIKAKIMQGENQTLMSLYTVPNGFTAFMIGYRFVTESTKILTARVKVREFGSSFNTKDLFSGIDPLVIVRIQLPIQIPGKSDIKLTAHVAASTANVSGIFELLLVDDDLVSALSFSSSIIS